MDKLTYRQAYDMIIDAYHQDKLKPMKSAFCFCGTLSPDSSWRGAKGNKYPYADYEYWEMEDKLFKGMRKYLYPTEFAALVISNSLEGTERYELALFEGMSQALDALKEIHRQRGEQVDEEQTKFIKREIYGKTENALQASV